MKINKRTWWWDRRAVEQGTLEGWNRVSFFLLFFFFWNDRKQSRCVTHMNMAIEYLTPFLTFLLLCALPAGRTNSIFICFFCVFFFQKAQTHETWHHPPLLQRYFSFLSIFMHVTHNFDSIRSVSAFSSSELKDDEISAPKYRSSSLDDIYKPHQDRSTSIRPFISLQTRYAFRNCTLSATPWS